MCEILYLDSGDHDYVLTTTESGAKVWSVKCINPTNWLKGILLLLVSVFVYPIVFDPAFYINLYASFFWFGTIVSEEEQS